MCGWTFFSFSQMTISLKEDLNFSLFIIIFATILPNSVWQDLTIDNK